MSNMIIAFPNRADAATLSGGSWSAGLPLTNLQDRRIKKLARSTDTTLTSTQFVVDLGVARPIKVVALISHNLSVDAQYRITADDDSGFASPGYESDWQSVWPSMFSTDTLEWEDDNFWSGSISEDYISGYPAVLLHLVDTLAFRYWKIELSDASNPDGAIDLGRLFLAEQRSPAHNYSLGAKLGFESRTQVEESKGGVEFFDIYRAPRIYTFAMKYLTDVEAYEWIFEMVRRADIHGEILIIPDADDIVNRHRRTFLARLTVPSALEQVAYNLHSTSFNLRELI